MALPQLFDFDLLHIKPINSYYFMFNRDDRKYHENICSLLKRVVPLDQILIFTARI